MKDKKLGRVIEFWELELEEVDESRGGLTRMTQFRKKIVTKLSFLETDWVDSGQVVG